MTKTIKATTVKFTYSGTEIEGLVMPDGEYRIGVSQTAKLIFPETLTNSTKYVKAALGKESQLFQKVSSDLNRKKVNTITLDQFSEVVYYFAFEKNNNLAKAILKASVHFTIRQAFEVALGVEKTNVDGVAAYESLMKSKKARRELTDTLKDCYELSGDSPNYGRDTIRLYRILGLMDSYKTWKENNKDKNNKPFRHSWCNEDEKERITTAENRIKIYIEDFGMGISEALSKLKEQMS